MKINTYKRVIDVSPTLNLQMKIKIVYKDINVYIACLTQLTTCGTFVKRKGSSTLVAYKKCSYLSKVKFSELNCS